MTLYSLGIAQGICKESYAGNSRMNRYGAFNGLERPRRIDEKRTLDANGNLLLLGYDSPSSAPTASSVIDLGELTDNNWYSYKYIGLSSYYQRPIPVADDSRAYTRSNPSPVSNPVFLNPGDRACCVVMNYIPRIDITHLGLYRNLATPQTSNSSYEALQGPWLLTMVTSNASHGNSICVHDITADIDLGEELETDNHPPNAHPFACEAEGRIFAGGSRAVGSGLTCEVRTGSWGIRLETSGYQFYDGIRGWRFTILGDNTGGVDGLGNYFCRYINENILQLTDESNNPVAYNGSMSGVGRQFVAYLDGRLLRWSKWHEPEAWPLENAAMMRSEIMGIAQIPNQSMLTVFTDEPEIRRYDLTSIGTPQFDTSVLLSNEFTAYHFTLIPVEGRLRGLDVWRGCIWECDGAAVRNITKGILKNIWKYLSTQVSKQINWHGVYDAHQEIFAEFVTLSDSFRMVDFAIIQNLATGRWFFGWPKDLLSSCPYFDPDTGRWMALGGTQGLGHTGGTWGRLWTPGYYMDWIFPGSLYEGTIVSSTDTVLTVDVSGGTTLQTVGDGLKGRWVLVCDEDEENEQLGLISNNTAQTITVNVVYGSSFTDRFFPVPSAGWKFRLGLIEVRWGPKRFIFDDPSVMKHILEIYARLKNADSDNPPFIRLYRGTESDYNKQISLYQTTYKDKETYMESWGNTRDQIEEALQWGMAFYDRSYKGIELEDISIIFNPVT